MNPANVLSDTAAVAIPSAEPRSRSRVRTLVFRIVSVGAGLIVGLLLMEAALRVGGWPAPGLYINGRGPFEFRLPGKNGGAFPPDTVAELRHYDYSVECRSNHYGFRDRTVEPKKGGEWRIGFLGDSFTAGIGVKAEDRFTDIFGSRLRVTQPNATVWNLGAPSCGTACEAEMLNYANHDYQLDEVVLAFYGGNDVEDNQEWFASNQSESPRDAANAGRARAWLRQHVRLTSFLWINVFRAWANFAPPGIYSQADLDKRWPDTARALESLRKSVGSKRLTILYLPAQPEWDGQVWQQLKNRYHFSDDSRYLVRQALATWAQQKQIAFVDATPWLRKCEPAGACTFRVDAHWTSKGHALVAEGLLTQTAWLKVTDSAGKDRSTP